MHTTFLVGNNSRLADNRLTNKQLNDLIDYKLCSNICPGGLRLVLSLQWTPEWWTATPMMTNTTIPDKKWQPNWHPTTKPATTSKADFNAESISCFCVSCISAVVPWLSMGLKLHFCVLASISLSGSANDHDPIAWRKSTAVPDGFVEFVMHRWSG